LVLVFWDLTRTRPRETQISKEFLRNTFEDENEYDDEDEKTYNNENDKAE